MKVKKSVNKRRSKTAPAGRAEQNQSEADQTRDDHGAVQALQVEDLVHEAHVTVVNKRGLHARAAAKFVKLAGAFMADIQVTTAKGGLAGGAVVSGRSIMGLMMLAAAPGCVLHIAVVGSDGAAALSALVNLVEKGFDEID